MQDRQNLKKLTVLSLMIAVAMVLSFIESRIPTFVPVPGVKMGLANIAVMFTLYKLGTKSAAVVSLVRVFMMALLFGSAVSLIYSLSGAVLSFCVMLLLKSTSKFSEIGVSVTGGVAHNIGQIIAVAIVLRGGGVFVYLPVLLLFGVVSGAVIGTVSGLLIRRIDISKYIR